MCQQSKPAVAATFLKSQECRQRHRIIGDGNCLFRSFSYILFGTQDRHLELRAILTEFTSLNAAYFVHTCNPESVQEQHVKKMKKPCVWGTHVEIMALAATLNVPVFVAIKKNPYEYYWAKYAAKQKDEETWEYPANFEVLSTQLDHIEILHENDHYDVVVTAAGCLPVLRPPVVTVSEDPATPIVISV